jgi:LysR family glycine cleavage system transcriptional activator
LSRILPSLTALRAFDAAARHLSFIKAGAELFVTPGAISQQVRALEDQLGVKLFRRLTRGVLLTDAGQRYAKAIARIFDDIAVATRDVKRHSSVAELKVSTGASFAARWLIPRLGLFRHANPKIVLRVIADNRLTDFATEDVDLAIRFGPGDWPDLVTEFLFREDIFPVCSPKLLDGPVPLQRVEDLTRHTLLDDETDEVYLDLTWEHWLHEVGADDVRPPPGVRFTYSHMALQAAVAGQGVALGTSVLAADDLAIGNLVRPLAESAASRFAYYFVCPQDAVERPKIKAFRGWITGEARRFLANPPPPQAPGTVLPAGAG